MKATLFITLALLVLPTSTFASKTYDPLQDRNLDRSPQWNYTHHGALAELLVASYSGDIAGIDFALKHHAPINGYFPSDDMTPLDYASENNKLSAVKFLLNLGASINKDVGLMTALDNTRSNSIVHKYLLSRGAKSDTDLVLAEATNEAAKDAAKVPTFHTFNYPAPPPPPLQLTDSSMSSEYDDGSPISRTVTGTVINNTKKDYDYVEVDVSFFNDANQQVGSEIDNTQNLEAGSTWAFKVTYLGGDALAYKIKKVFGRRF